MEYLTIGQMAKICCVSEKTLYVYHDKGLLEPHHVDKGNGYRYYSAEQCSKIDLIARLQTIGFTLAEIKGILDSGDTRAVEQKVFEKLEDIKKQAWDLSIASQAAEDLLKSCSGIRGNVRCGVIQLETLPDRYIFSVDISGIVSGDHPDAFQWEAAHQAFKQALKEEGYGLSLAGYTGNHIALENVLDGTFGYNTAFAFVDPSFGRIFEKATLLPGGLHLTMYSDHAIDPESNDYRYEFRLVEQMVEYARNHGLVPCGDYFDEAVAGMALFNYRGRDALFKLNLPVRPA